MNFFNENPMSMPNDAQFFFDVSIINVAVRRGLQEELEDIWDISGVTEPRPIVIHVFQDDDDTFEGDDNWEVELVHHAILEVSPTLGVSFWLSDKTEDDAVEEDYLEPNDYWRF